MRTFFVALVLLALAVPSVAFAHAFPDHASPQAGATVTQAPQDVKIWFDAGIEPVFSHLIVKNAAGKQVSLGEGKVDKSNEKLLEAALPPKLPAGTYTVYWSVIAHDGHHTHGHYAFTVK